MPDRTNATASTAGVLRPDEFARHVRLERSPAGPGVAPWVENHWGLRWALPDGRWFASEVLPHPTCSLTVEHGHRRAGMPEGETVVVTGVCTRRFDVEIRGEGVVHGVRFRPGGLTALTGRPASGWVDRSVPARDVLPERLVARLADPALVEDPAAWRAAVEEELAAVVPAPDPRHEELLRIVADVLEDRSLLTVADVAARHGTTPRSLQRLFTHYVGVGPKWVLARYRMHDVVTALDDGYDGTLTDLAHRFGWYDQAHFTRDFTALVGVTPGRYRSRR
ncbi:helix-turn-helix domain-containing protein [Phycicoccus sonneratiae]|uniref:Helix-turn-helix transcriptional regulator n=1 Tax=Phycicoccus sonneratiae TaxID=2807628 RepID=A0ABS2CRP1_9MICO|nr:helix-turn-helix transcriptional regulator [Phycicoccus sonneraticus]MBM6402545.1 helix-turn-helix transcriptional regulator [Phycicoccus sonneraticus]